GGSSARIALKRSRSHGCSTALVQRGAGCSRTRPVAGWNRVRILVVPPRMYSCGGSCCLPGCWAGSYDQGGDECAKQGFAATACVVHALEKAEIERQFLLRDPPVRAEPGAQQGPEPLDGVDVHLAKAIPVLVAGVFAAPVANRLVLVAPALQAGVDAILVGMDEGALGNRGRDDRLDRRLLHVG